MTISTNPSRNEYTATAAQTVFNYTFKIYDSGDLNVYVTPVGQDPDDATDITTDFVVDAGTIGDEAGGFITFNTGITVGYAVTIVSDIPDDRTTDYQVNGDFDPPVVNNDFDRVVSIVKQFGEKVDRSIVARESEQGASGKVLPIPNDGKGLIWDGSDLVNSTEDIDGIAAAAAASAAAALVSENNASSSASAASSSASAASTSETNSATSAAAALVSENNAAATLADALVKTNNLSDVSSATTSRSNLGLGIGVDVQAFDSALETGATKTSRKNAIINPNFDIWQRGVSFSGGSIAFTSDRWEKQFAATGGAGTVTREAFAVGQTDVPGNPKFFYRHDQSTGIGGAGLILLAQPIEGVETFSGDTVTLTLSMKADAARDLDIRFRQDFGTGGSPSSSVTMSAQTLALTTAWQKFTLQFAIDSISGKTLGSDGNDALILQLRDTDLGTFTIDFAQVQIEKGAVASEFERRNIGEELSLCQRYYFKTFDQSVTPVQNAGRSGAMATAASSNGRWVLTVDHPVTMRASPTLVLYNPSASNTEARNANDGTDTPAQVSAPSNDRKTTVIILGALDATDANDVMEIHATADAEL